MPVKQIINSGKVPVKIYTDDINNKTVEQLSNLSQLNFIHHHVAAMPDAHVGMGSTVGSVIPTYKAIIPASVGVDIGCGMSAVRLSLKAKDLPDNLKPLRLAIEKAVPVGTGGHKEYNWRKVGLEKVEKGITPILQKYPAIQARWQNQMGSLGGGNHFIEICLDENQDVWIMLHSGSRGIGNQIGSHFISLAKKDMGRWFIHLPDHNLAYFPEGSEYFNDYIYAVNWAQEYAMENRRQIMTLVIEAIQKTSGLPSFELTREAINCHHNYVEKENHFGKNCWVTRKGAIRARKEDLGIIPGSMGAKSFIVRGKGNPDSFCSCSHGAGRKMSRTQAKEQFSINDLKQQTEGVECRKDENVIDEIPGAYKDIDEVMANQSDLVEVMHTLKQVLTVKG